MLNDKQHSRNMSLKFEARPTVEYMKLIHILWEQWTSMIVFKTMKYYGVPPKVTGTVIVILTVLGIYSAKLIITGVLYSGSGEGVDSFAKTNIGDNNILVLKSGDLDNKKPSVLLDKLHGAARNKRSFDNTIEYTSTSSKNNENGKPAIIQTRKLFSDENTTDSFQATNRRLPPQLNKNLYNSDINLGLHFINRNVSDKVDFKKDTPIIWITGYQESGNSQLRAVIDSHPNISCSGENLLINQILKMHYPMLARKDPIIARLQEANNNMEVFYNAIGSYIMSLLANDVKPATTKPSNLCTMFAIKYNSIAVHLQNIFPNSKFILMIRDGRAVAYYKEKQSKSDRKIINNRVDFYRSALKNWNKELENSLKMCAELGSSKCRVVKYENLVLHSEEELTGLFNWLGILWHIEPAQLQNLAEEKSRIYKSRKGQNAQLSEPESLYEWMQYYPEELKSDWTSTLNYAPMLAKLGYGIKNFSPNYTELH